MAEKVRERNHKIVGYVSEEVANEWNLSEHKGKPIIQTLSFYKHIQKHIPHFESVDSFNEAMLNIENIILSPDLVYHNGIHVSLEYYKKVRENVFVAAKLTNKNKLYLSTLFPVSDHKVKNKIEKSVRKKYIENFDEVGYNEKQKKRYDKNKKVA